MPYKNIVFAKLEKRLLSDHRWYMMSENAQLNYIKLILVAAETYNKIPRDYEAIRRAFKTEQSLEMVKQSIDEIRRNFPKFKQNKAYYFFDGFEEKTNYIPKREIPRKSLGLPKDGVDKEEDKEEEEDEDKEKNTVTRDCAATGEELKKTDFILRLKDEEKSIFLSSIYQLIKDENVTRPRNPFRWQPRPGCTPEKDWLALIYQDWTDDEKVKILTDALNLLHGKLNWSNYVTIGIKYLIRATRKSPIRTHYGFVRMVLKQPLKLASESFDGVLK